MGITLAIHVLCGIAGLFAGYVALYASKGAPMHRRSGMVFVTVMLTVSVSGLMISAVRGVAPELNIPTSAVTFYMALTGLMTVQPPSPLTRRLDQIAMAIGVATALGCALYAPGYFTLKGAASVPAYPLTIFGTVSLLGAIGDARVLRSGAPKGAARLRRHLWRMCFALFVASLAVFAPAARLPIALRSPALRIIGVLIPIVAIAFWMWRLRARRATQVVSGFVMSEAAS